MEKREVWKPEVTLIFVTPNAEGLIEQAYRNCWQSSKASSRKARQEFIERCIRRGHLSPLEFAFAIFEIVGSRAFTHQLVRHRVASYAQESQRYVKVKTLDYFVIPPTIQENPQAHLIFKKTLETAFSCYETLISLGIPKEDARYILPNATKSKILVGMNFRSWRHFLKLRCEKSAQWEIREAALQILQILYQESPSVFGDLYQKFILKNNIELWTERD